MYDIKYFEERYPDYCREMKDTMQHYEWHGEGNVFIHTEMVLNELMNLKEYQELLEIEQMILAYSAFFHDISKFETSTIENGIISSKGHAKLGEKKARLILSGIHFDPMRYYGPRLDKFDFYFREKIVMLVRYHGYPVFYLDKHKYDLIKLSLKVNIKHLYILCKADLLGRITSKENKEESLMKLDYFKEKALEFNCYENEFQFENEFAKMYFLKNNRFYTPYIEKHSKVYLMVGIPGVGKDFYIKNNLKDINEISLDKLRIEMKVKRGDKKREGRLIQEAKKRAKEFLAKKEDFVWNATNTNISFREPLIDLFLSYKAEVEIIYIEKDFDIVLKQNKNRKNSIPEAYIFDKLRFIDIPTKDEAHKVKYILD